jgi:pyruvate/2-oxoglutarate dehydrogenase complex dihydrolipoamide dehydrogenase (E3) component
MGFLNHKGSDEILGATVMARHAEEMISEVMTAIVGKVGLSRMAAIALSFLNPSPSATYNIIKKQKNLVLLPLSTG